MHETLALELMICCLRWRQLILSSLLRRNNRRDEPEGWSHVKTGSQRVDPSKLKLTKQNLGDGEIQLGPVRAFGGWGKGSANSGRSIRPQQEERPSTPTNRFHVRFRII